MPFRPTCLPADLESRIAAQGVAIAELERALWAGGLNEVLLAPYQAAFRELERLIAACGEDSRHRFVLVIPVADSPLHLQDCLSSLLELCTAYGYGGQVDGRWRKVSVLLADDSGDAASITKNREIAAGFDHQGLATEYFGLAEQIALLDRLAGLELSAIVGSHRREAFHHKGQAMMRNLAYLKLAELAAVEPLLFYTLDADQEFKVKVATAAGGRDVCAVNFLYRLDEIFRASDVQVLTGKVVGDPPVSPAVMAGNFLEDVTGFLREMAAAAPRQAYRQPDFGDAGAGDAAYHDMADLFGFKPGGEAYRYRCALPGTPDNSACFAEFSRRLNRFFHGEHPTRITWYSYQAALASVQPARTVYTGNYVFRPAALGWFIPFAPLRLRMSGPSMGRLLRAEIGGRFVTANLPMLHKRTVAATGQAEFRPGIVAVQERIDLCGEFERQFFGDVMLFTLERLTALGYPAQRLDERVVGEILDAVRGEMREKYRGKQRALLGKLGQLTALLDDPANWWNRSEELADAVAQFHSFAANLDHNFGTDSPCFARIDAPDNRETWHARQLAAIAGFQADREVWSEALALFSPLPQRGRGRG